MSILENNTKSDWSKKTDWTKPTVNDQTDTIIKAPTFEAYDWSRSKFNNWLKSIVNDKYINNKYQLGSHTLQPLSLRKNHFYRYYRPDNDLDVYHTDESMIYLIKQDEDDILNDFIEEYTTDNQQNINIFLPPNTNIYHANHLFKKMVNNCNQNNYIYKISSDKGGVRNELLIDPDFKEAFYKFCYKNT